MMGRETSQPSTRETATETEMKQLCSLFTETIMDLSEEVGILQQMASLQIATGINGKTNQFRLKKQNSFRPQDQSQTPAHVPVDENTDPNTLSHPHRISNTQDQIQQNVMQQLTGVNVLLSQLETKVSTIQHVLSEEIQAMQMLEQTKTSALGQAKVIEEIRQGIEDQELEELLPGNGALKNGYKLNTLGLSEDDDARLVINESIQNGGINGKLMKRGSASGDEHYGPKIQQQSGGNSPQTTESSAPKSSTTATSKSTSTIASTPTLISTSISTPKINKSHSPPPVTTLRPITQSEFNNISKNIRRRITLSALNEALIDIQHVVQHKYTILALRKTPRMTSKPLKTKGQPMQYQQTLALHKELQSGDHDGKPFISEQEMRDSCSFFRSGESTARAILQILRSARRMRQVCGRKSQVTYVWLNE